MIFNGSGEVKSLLLSGQCSNEQLAEKTSRARKKKKTGMFFFFICFDCFKFHQFNTDLPKNCV